MVLLVSAPLYHQRTETKARQTKVTRKMTALDVVTHVSSAEKKKKTRNPTNWLGSAKRDVTYPIATVVYNICYHLFRKRLFIAVDRDNNTTPAIYVMHRSIIGLEYNNCNYK